MKALVTAFGKELRKMRIDAGEVLKDMAFKLGITSSYLSAIEVGKRTVSDKLLKKIHEAYGLSEEKMSILTDAVEQDKPRIEFNLKNATQAQRSTVLAFARTFHELDQDTLEKIQKLLNEGNEDD